MKQWEEKFTNYVGAHLGVSSIPLSYIICKTILPVPNATYPDFVSMAIAYTPLAGEYYKVDNLTVFNMIIVLSLGSCQVIG